MSSCAELYDEIENLNIKVTNFPLREKVALIGPEGYLAIDYSKIKTTAEEKAVLLEEIGHFCTYSFYSVDAPHRVWEKQEHRAMRYVFEKHYPPEMLAELMMRGQPEMWNLAEALDLPEPFVCRMVQFYFSVRGVDFDALADKIRKEREAKEPPQTTEKAPRAEPDDSLLDNILADLEALDEEMDQEREGRVLDDDNRRAVRITEKEKKSLREKYHAWMQDVINSF